MTVVGIDLSTFAIDLVALDENTDAATWHRVTLTGADAFDRARSVRAAMPPASFWDDVLAVGVEQPRGRNALVALGRVQGAVLACVPADKLVRPWNPSEWRKAVGLPGNCAKDRVLASVYHRAPWPADETRVWEYDCCDAYCIALATRGLIEHKAAA